MSNEALNDIQKSLNAIRSIADKERLDVKLKVLELMTQALQSHITGIKTAAANKKKNGKPKPKLPKPAKLPIPKSLNTPSSANNPNSVIPNEISSQSVIEPITPITPQPPLN